VTPDPPSTALGNIPPEVQAAVDPHCPGCQALLGFFEAQLAGLAERTEQLDARVNRTSANSSRPPSADPPAASQPPRPRAAAPRKPGGQPGHRGVSRHLKPLEAVAAVVETVPTRCTHCQTSLPAGGE